MGNGSVRLPTECRGLLAKQVTYWIFPRFPALSQLAIAAYPLTERLCVPTSTNRLCFLAAFTICRPSQMKCASGFST